jgi:hypothetical protein
MFIKNSDGNLGIWQRRNKMMKNNKMETWNVAEKAWWWIISG